MNEHSRNEEYNVTLSTNSSSHDDNSKVLTRDEIVAELEKMKLPPGVKFKRLDGVNHQYDVLVIDPLLINISLSDSVSCVVPMCLFSVILENVAKTSFLDIGVSLIVYSIPIFFLVLIIVGIVKTVAFDEYNYIVILKRSLICFKGCSIPIKPLIRLSWNSMAMHRIWLNLKL